MGSQSLLSLAHSLLSTDNEFFDIFIDGIDDQVFSLPPERLNDLVQSISSLLSKATSRALGVRLLNKYLEQCSGDVFNRTGNLWTSLVLKSCQGQNDCAEAYEVLEKLPAKFMQTPELTKTFATTHLAKIYETLVGCNASCVVPALRCMETCLRLFPSASGPSKRLVEKFLLRFCDNLDADVICCVGKCFHLLQQVSGGDANSSNHKTLWKNYQLQLVGSIHEVFDGMFANCADLWDGNAVQERLQNLGQLELSPEPINKSAQLYVRFHNLTQYLIIALKEPFPVEKPLMPRMLLELIGRGLGVTCNVLYQNPISDNISLALLMPKVHEELLQLLDVLCIILRGHLLPHYNLVLGLLIDALKSTAADEEHDENQKPFRQVRAKVYDSIALWCRLHNAGSCIDSVSEQLLPEILNDITHKTHELTLQVTKAIAKHTSKKVKRQMQKAQNERSKISQSSLKGGRGLKASYNEQLNQKLCIAALKCLQDVLLSAGNFIKPNRLRQLHVSILQVSGAFYELPLEAKYLYSNPECRLEIYNTLFVLLSTPHHLSPPPADIMLSILNIAAARDGNVTVRNQCSRILQNLEKIVHPQKESLVFPIEAKDIRNAFIMLGQEKLLTGGAAINGVAADDSDDEVEDAAEDSDEEELLKAPENGAEILANGSIKCNGDMNGKEIEDLSEVLEKPSNQQPTEESMTSHVISDSEEDINDEEPEAEPVEISSGDENGSHLKLRFDEDSKDSVIVEVINEDKEEKEVQHPVAKKPKFDENESQQVLVKDQDKIEDKHKNADDIIMEMDEDALVEDIASQFVDDLA